MHVHEAVAARRSIRAFLDTPVDLADVERLALQAARAPSGGNLQPWHVDLVGGAALDGLKHIMLGRLMSEPESPEYSIYPTSLASPYRDRGFAVGEALYERIGIPREDKGARRAWFARNFAFFGAPAALFVTVDRAMGLPQWSDLGMFLQSFHAARGGTGSRHLCTRMLGGMYPQTVKAFLGTPPQRMLFCGMAIGFEDTNQRVKHARNGARAPR